MEFRDEIPWEDGGKKSLAFAHGIKMSFCWILSRTISMNHGAFEVRWRMMT
jgi:hypothetical protein